MPRIKHYVQLVVFDALAIIAMVGAILTGWLPGPGGVPLFIIGLSLLAINHDWAEKYIDLVREYADKLSDLIFTPRLRVFFDLLAPVLLVAGGAFVYFQNAIWMFSIGLLVISMGLLTFFGNRNRWARFKKSFPKKR